MDVKGLVWVGTATDRYDETVAFFRDVIGLGSFHASPELTILRAPTGEWLEVFGPAHAHFVEFDTGPVVEFLVEDVAAARAELEARGVEFLHETHSWNDYAWAHFRAPDSRIYGITSGPYRPS